MRGLIFFQCAFAAIAVNLRNSASKSASLDDVLAFAKNVESLGALYEQEAASLPSFAQRLQTLQQTNVETLGLLGSEAEAEAGGAITNTGAASTSGTEALAGPITETGEIIPQ